MEPTSNSNSSNNLQPQSDQLSNSHDHSFTPQDGTNEATNSGLLSGGVNMNSFMQQMQPRMNPSMGYEGTSPVPGPAGSNPGPKGGGMSSAEQEILFQRTAMQQQAQAAHAAAAMAEKRLAMSNSRAGDRVSAAPGPIGAKKNPAAWVAALGQTGLMDSQLSANDLMSQTSSNPALAGAPGLPYNPYSAMMYPNILLNQQGLGQPNMFSQASALGGISSLGSSGLVGANNLPTMNQTQTPSSLSLSQSAAAAKISGGYTDIPPTSAVKKKKIKGKPKRPLSAYNLFFKHERANILESLKDPSPSSEEEGETSKDKKNKDGESSDKKVSDTENESPGKEKKAPKKKTPHGKIGFENLAKTIGQRWSQLDKTKLEKFKKMALQDMKRYKEEMEVFLTKQQEIQEKERKSAQQLVQQHGIEEEKDSPEKFGKRKFDQLSDQSLQEKEFEDEDQFNNPLQRQQLHVQQLQQQLQQQQQQQQLQNLVLQQQQAFFDMSNPQKIQQDGGMNLGAGMPDPNSMLYSQGLGGLGNIHGAGGGNSEENNAVDQNLLAKLMAQQNAGLGGLNGLGAMQGFRGMGGANMGGLNMTQQNNMSQAPGTGEEVNSTQNGQNGTAQQQLGGNLPWMAGTSSQM